MGDDHKRSTTQEVCTIVSWLVICFLMKSKTTAEQSSTDLLYYSDQPFFWILFTQHKEEVNFEQSGNEINKAGQAPTKTDAQCMGMVV
jgi:hypothetical protein